MPTLTASEARRQLYRLLDAVAEEGEPVLITGKRHNAVLISEEDWRGIRETLYLNAVPGMVKSVQEGMDSPAEGMDTELEW